MNFLSQSNPENTNQNQSNQNTINNIYNSSSQSMQSITNKFEEKIIEVYQDNFIKEIKRIGKYLKQYPYIGMDTEFPGIVYPCTCTNSDFYYHYIKTNVDKLKLIQLGITLTNAKGEKPPYTTTWQFNLKFDYENDIHSTESISLLYNSGINFHKLKKEGISNRLFAEYLTVSGMVLNENVVWISFNGFSDFAYLLKLLTGDILPNNTNEFLELLKIYFPNAYDIKYLIKDNELYKGGLVKISKELNIERKGEVHQAGSDSLVTSEVFFKLIENNSINKIEQNQVIYNNKENTYNNIQQVPIQFKNENQIKIEKENNNMKLYYDINNNEEDSSPQDLNKLYIDTQSNHQINYNNEQIQSSEQMESKSDLEEILEHQNDENKVIQNTQQIKSEIIQNIPIQNIQQKKVEITKNVIPIQNSSQNIQQKKVEIIQKVKPFQNNIYNIQQTKSEIIQNTIPIQRNVQGIQQQREEIVRIPFQNNVQNIQQKKEIIVQNIMPAQNNTQTTTNKKEEIVNIIPSQNYIQNVKQKNEEIVNILPPQNIQQNIEEKKVELGENSIPFQYNISKFNIQQNGAKINTKSFLKKSEFDNLETNIQQQKIEKVNNIGINPQKNIQKKQVLQTQVQEYNNKYNINAQQKMTSTAKTTSTIQKTVNKRQSQVKKHIKSQANINKGDIGEQHEIEENSKEGVTEYARASVYETVLDITKKKTIMQEIQKLKTIVKKADISVSVNKAIINEVTNKELISENTLPIQYLPEKIHNVIFQEKVITLPIINAGNKVIYKYLEPTVHKYDEYLKEINIINNNSINEYNYENLMSNEQKQSINNNIYNSENNINNSINSNLISSGVIKTDILQENIQPTQFKVQIKKLNEEKI